MNENRSGRMIFLVIAYRFCVCAGVILCGYQATTILWPTEPLLAFVTAGAFVISFCTTAEGKYL